MPRTYHENDKTATPDPEPSFAELAAQDAFGRRYVPPDDRNFVDHEPRWQNLGDVSDGVVEGLRRRRDHHLAGLDIDGDGEHDMAEV